VKAKRLQVGIPVRVIGVTRDRVTIKPHLVTCDTANAWLINAPAINCVGYLRCSDKPKLADITSFLAHL